MAERTCLHATCVAFEGKGALILGASGSGKSSLALQLLALGCDLVSDDQTEVVRQGEVLWASAPDPIKGLIEARGVGLLRARADDAPVALAIDLDQPERDRLPQFHSVTLLGLQRPCLHNANSQAWPSAIVQCLKQGRHKPE
ncbi:MAG: hypothetical protein AAF727_12760 [Pseudomonadota bacterium]